MNKKLLYFLPILLLLFLLIYFIMPDEKVYTPTVVKDTPFPQEEIIITGTSQSTKGGVYSPTTTKENKFPRKVIAQETIGQALNTKSRKILGEFEFTESGAIKVGKYVNGVSGELSLSPNGITAKDSAGLTTFAIDGTTGSAVFKGDVRAKGFTVIDGEGLVSMSNFRTDSVKTGYQTFDSTDYADVTDSVLTFTLSRESVVIFWFQATTEPDTTTMANGDNFESWVSLFANDTNLETAIRGQSKFNDLLYSYDSRTISSTVLQSLDAGEYVVKLRCKKLQNAGATGTIKIWSSILSYLILGR